MQNSLLFTLDASEASLLSGIMYIFEDGYLLPCIVLAPVIVVDIFL